MLPSSGLGVLKAFREQRLLTDGFFAVFPNPMYVAYVLAIVPGLAQMLDSWLVLTGSPVLYALSRALVPAEEWKPCWLQLTRKASVSVDRRSDVDDVGVEDQEEERSEAVSTAMPRSATTGRPSSQETARAGCGSEIGRR